MIAETVAICEYLEEIHPTPALIGSTPEDRAETRMWQRRVELGITEHLYNGFRFAEGIELFRSRMRVLPEASDGLKAIVRDKLGWLDGLLAGKQYLAGDRFTLADIILFSALDFGRTVGQPFDTGLGNVARWFNRVAAPPSPKAGGENLSFWRAANDRAQAQAVAAEVERLISREGVPPTHARPPTS